MGQRQTLAWSALRTIREMNPSRFCGYGGRISPTVNTLGAWIQKRAAIELGMTHPSSNVPKGAGSSMWEPQTGKNALNPHLSRLFRLARAQFFRSASTPASSSRTCSS